jgi:hypothetical protein
MWWMYIGLGVVVAFLVIFVFAMLAASSTDIGESSRVDLAPSRRSFNTRIFHHRDHRDHREKEGLLCPLWSLW